MSSFFENNPAFEKIDITVPPSRVVVINQILPEYTYIYEYRSILYEDVDYTLRKNLTVNTTEIKFVGGLEGARLSLFFEKNNNLCRHTYEQYVGFTETYSYCTKCDKKEIKNG